MESFFCFHSFMKLRINYIFSVIVLLFSKEGLKQLAKAVSLLILRQKVIFVFLFINNPTDDK